MTPLPLSVHVRDVLDRLYASQARKPGNRWMRPGELADATIIALVERENGNVFDLSWRAPYLTLQERPPLAGDALVAPLLRRNWRDFVLNDGPVPGTWRGWLWCLRQCRRDASAAGLIAGTMEWHHARALVIGADWRALGTLWRWRPLVVDLFGVMTVLAGAVWYVGWITGG